MDDEGRESGSKIGRSPYLSSGIIVLLVLLSQLYWSRHLTPVVSLYLNPHAMPFRLQRALSLTSRFLHPLIEMGPTPEILSRASCFAVLGESLMGQRYPACQPGTRRLSPIPAGDTGRFLVASQHVTSPYNFPQYYPEDTHGFVHALEPCHITLSIELRDAEGAVSLACSLRGPVITHPSRDLVIIPVDGVGPSAPPEQLDALLEGATVPLDALGNAAAAGGEAAAEEGATTSPSPPPRMLAFLGHSVASDAVVPRRIPGVWLGRSDRQAFARTAEVLETGMCGGPVIQLAAGAAPQLCVGMIEGIVPAQPPAASAGEGEEGPRARAARLLAGAAAIIEGQAIAAFVRAADAQRRQQRGAQGFQQRK